MPVAEPARRFQLFLVKPSHYGDDGYVVQWLRSNMPSNSLAVLYGLAAEASENQVLGPDVAIDIAAMDETNTRVRTTKIIETFKAHDNFGLVAIVGAQSNEFPRAVDIARPLRAAGLPVVIGGFHVSGCLAMLPEIQPDLQEALDLGITLFAGEAEGRLDQLLQDAAAGSLEPIYNYMSELPDLGEATSPFLPSEFVNRVIGNVTSFDAGRGCPYQCSFCTIINVQGRKSRYRTPDGVERIIRENLAQGIDRFFITDDNFARNKDWEAILDRIIELREREGIELRFMIQVDTLCHKIPNFIDKCKRAGVTRAFIGLENINPDNLMAAKKRQNKITEYRKMLLEWRAQGIFTYAGYILGFPRDTLESIREDIEIIKRELPIDILEFLILTPLPGSEDHKVLYDKGVWMDPDMNKYDLEHVTMEHPRMSKSEWEAAYRQAWDIYYCTEHVETVLRRAKASGINLVSLMVHLLWFRASLSIENVHPLQGGIFRLKYRTDRRPGTPLEPVWVFYPKYLWEIVHKHARLVRYWWQFNAIRKRIDKDPQGASYMDQALTPVREEEVETLDMFTHSEAARDAVQHQRKVAGLAN